MKILPIACAAGVALAALAPTAASADVTYVFTGSYTTDRDANNDPTASQTGTFTFTSPRFITGRHSVTPTVCETNDARYLCSPTQRVEAYPNGFGPAVMGDYIGFNLTNADGSGSGTGFYFFQPGALGAVGSYGTINPGGGYGNAGVATLVVSGLASIVPEPATWAMLILGFGTVGTLMRRRRPTPALASMSA